MRTVTILQARTTSTRLPGKVLKPILDKPMMQHQIERTRLAANIGHLVIATSDESDDDAIEELCSSLAADCFRGSLDDVLDRYYQAALRHKPQHVVRMTCDCPLSEPRVIDETIARHLQDENDYTFAARESGYPWGISVEVMRFETLATAWREAKPPYDREHVTPFIKRHPKRFHAGRLSSPVDYSHLRWTVDTADDFTFVEQVYEALYPNNPHFTMEDVLDLLRRQPELTGIKSAQVSTSREQ